MTIGSRKITAFVKTIAALADAPALGSSALLKAWFDSSPEELRLEINGVIDDLLAVAPGASGADNIGSAPITGVTGATAYAQLVSLKALIDTNATAIALKAPSASPTFTGTVVLPSTTSIGNVSAAEIAFLDNVTSAIQPQLNARATGSSSTGSPIGVVTPTAAGQLYMDQTTGLTYVSTGATNTSWVVEPSYFGMSQQAIINAAMEVWQQGTTFTNPATGVYTADMWVLAFSNPASTMIHTQVALTAGELFNSKYAYNINVNGAGSGFFLTDFYGFKQRIEFGTSKLCGNGKKVTVSFYAKSNIATKRIAAGFIQNYGTGGSPSASEILTPTATTVRSLTTTMSLYTFTFTTNTLTGKTFGTNNDDYLELGIYIMWGTTFATNNLGGGTQETYVGAGNVTFTEVVVNAGDVALPYQPKSYAQELADCMRYLIAFSSSDVNAIVGAGVANSTTTARIVVNLPVQMRVIPALIATFSDWQVYDYISLTSLTGIALITGVNSTKNVSVQCTVASGLTQFRLYQLLAGGTANRIMLFDARL